MRLKCVTWATIHVANVTPRQAVRQPAACPRGGDHIVWVQLKRQQNQHLGFMVCLMASIHPSDSEHTYTHTLITGLPRLVTIYGYEWMGGWRLWGDERQAAVVQWMGKINTTLCHHSFTLTEDSNLGCAPATKHGRTEVVMCEELLKAYTYKSPSTRDGGNCGWRLLLDIVDGD